MKYVVTASEMKRYDTNMTEYYGIPSLLLMERAALSLVSVITERFLKGGRILVVFGNGNNGGDGLAAGRMLMQKGFDVSFFNPQKDGKYSDETRKQLSILEKFGKVGADTFPEAEYDIIIDALFGIGLTRAIEGEYARAVAKINEAKAFVISCDIPSGINSDDGSVMGTAVRADLTVAFAFYKRGHFFYPGTEYAGELICTDIGIGKESFFKEAPKMTLLEKEDIKDLLPARDKSGNKGSFGKTLVIAGSTNMSGACELCVRSAYRSGAGMVKIMTVDKNREILQRNIPEALLDAYAEEADSFPRLGENLTWADCIAVGPGLSTSETAERLLKEVLFSDLAQKALVLDADALNMIAGREAYLSRIKELAKSGVQIVMTPHMGEFSRLLKQPVQQLKENPALYAKEFAKEYGVIMVCKDARTIIAPAGGSVFLNITGNDGMATAGSGDVLTGVIAGLLAQNKDAAHMAALGVLLHGCGGDEAEKEKGRYGLMAQDIIAGLTSILKEVAL